MSKYIDKNRRQFLKAGGLIPAVILMVNRLAVADELTDLIMRKFNQVIAVRLWPSSVYTRLTIESDDKIVAKYFKLENPKRLVIDIMDVELNSVLRELSYKIFKNDPVINDIKVAQYQPFVVRIVIYLKQDVLVQNNILNPVNLANVSYKFRYIVDMYHNSNSNSSDEPLNDDLLALLQLNTDIIDINHKAVINPNQQKSKVESTIFKSVKKKILIMIDPGHGGEDPGAIGPSGAKEKNVVLDIGHKLYKLINETNYMAAQMTRMQDIFIPLGARVEIARRAKADIFISIHADAFSSPLANGSSVFVLSDKGASSAFARWLAQTQNDSDLIGGLSYKVKDRSVNRILLDMTQTWTRSKSNLLGGMLLQNMASINRLHSKHVEKASFLVLKSPDIPSILVETAFISNHAEEAKLKNPEFRHKIAVALFNGLNKFSKNIFGVKNT